MNQLTLSSPQTIIALAERHPGLKGIKIFSVALKYTAILNKKGGCNCNKNVILDQASKEIIQYIPTLTSGDIQAIKKILKVDEVCYYTRSQTGQLIRKCL